jgi:hypothetical protein
MSDSSIGCSSSLARIFGLIHFQRGSVNVGIKELSRAKKIKREEKEWAFDSRGESSSFRI